VSASLATRRGWRRRRVNWSEGYRQVAPVYPPLAKRMNVKGVVKLEVVVRANGTVVHEVVGGNPVTDCAHGRGTELEVELAPNETKGVVEVLFDGLIEVCASGESIFPSGNSCRASPGDVSP